jgi:hypothetical protein
MSWINKHLRVWRVAILVLLLVAIMGPWTFGDRINVPSEYPCSAPWVRLEGDFCGMLLSGIGVFSWMVGGLINLGVRLATGATAFTDVARVLLFSLLLLLLVAPFFSTLRLILGGDRRRWRMFHVVAWGLAVGTGLLLGLSGSWRLSWVFSRLFWVLWGIWLYIGLAGSALILEVLVLVAGRRPDRG